MTFELLPLLDRMLDFYMHTPTSERFNRYLHLLQGDTKGDLILPIGGFNPMAKAHVTETLQKMKNLNAEEIITEILNKVNDELKDDPDPIVFKTGFNLSDDLKGGWTNHYTSDYQSKFVIQPLIRRHFCVPVFWTSEIIDVPKIQSRTYAYCYRSLYFFKHGRPITLEQHVVQELFVCNHASLEYGSCREFEQTRALFDVNRQADDPTRVLNFLYGDQAAIALGNNPMGITENFGGYRFIKYLSEHDLQP